MCVLVYVYACDCFCQQVGSWVTFLSKEEWETSVCSVNCEITGLIRAHGPSVECIVLLLVSVVSELLFYSTITHYRTVTLLCINLHLLILHLRVVPLLFHHLPSSLTLSPSYCTLECVCVLEQHVPCIFSRMLMSEIMCCLNTPDQ